MIADYKQLTEDFRTLGIVKGDSVIVHSSYKSMGGIEGGIETLIEAMLSVVGDSGTLIFPTLTYVTVTAQNPIFDYLRSPSCTGAISEYVRNMNSSIRSIHPTHSVAAIGANATYFTGGHENDRTPCGENSPFRKNIESGGKILMLGCNVAYNTTFHALEEMANTSYVLTSPPIEHTIILPSGSYKGNYRRHSIVQNGYAQRYDRITAEEGNGLIKGYVHGAHCHLFSADIMAKCALSLMSKDEKYFVEKIQKN